MTAILGISAFYHDSAAALVVDGEIIAAAQEERFSRKKYDAAFPAKSIDFCLKTAGLTPADLDFVGFYDKPLLKFERLLETYLAGAPAGFRSFMQAMPVWLRQKLHLPREMSGGLNHAYKKRFIFTEHHESHAASAFFPSPFEEAAILTMDGVGEWATASWGVGRGNLIELRGEQRFPHSLGLLYSAFTYYTGFAVNSGEYKLMGLAPYGEPKYLDLILEQLIDLKDDGSFRMDMSYFNYCHGLTMTSEKFHRLFGGPPRKPDSVLSPRDMDVAASIQKVTEEIMLRSARYVYDQTGLRNLCLAGGVALNCVANGRILREGPFENIWIQPAAGDAGGALGTALFIWHQLLGNSRTVKATDSQHGSLLGPTFSDRQIQQFLDSVDARYCEILDNEQLCTRIAKELAEGKIVGWMQGALEFGPRALGSRSLLGDPRNPHMQTVMNVKVKFREGFRPFAPAVLAERSHEYFEVEEGTDSPYMLVVAPVREEKRLPQTDDDRQRAGIDKLKTLRSVVPAITHVDYTARIQTVDRERHGLYHGVLDAFYRKTGCPVLVNTSFNLGWEPIVCTPQEAYNTFMASDIDLLCMGHFILTKSDQHSFAPRVKSASAIAVSAVLPDPPRSDPRESLRTVIEGCRRDPFLRALDESIPYNTDVLEVGCGTGKVACFLGVGCRSIIGTDASITALQAAEALRREHDLHRVCFVQMNPLDPCFQPERFDFVLCNAFDKSINSQHVLESLTRLLKPGGFFIVRGSGLDLEQIRGWFAARGLIFVREFPSVIADYEGLPRGMLLQPISSESTFDRLLLRARRMFTSGFGGGESVFVGQKS